MRYLKQHKTIMVLAIYLFLFLLFFYKPAVKGEVFYCCDNLLLNLPIRAFLMQELHQGRFPLWNNMILSGTPFLADINNSPLYPGNLFFWTGGGFGALTWSILMHFFLTGIGMFVFARSLKLSHTASLAGTIIWLFNGAVIGYSGNLPMLQTASFIPWIFWAANRYFGGYTSGSFLMLVALLSLQILAGHPQLVYYTWLAMAAYVFFSVRKTGNLRHLVYIAMSVVGLTAVQLWPFVEFAWLSSRIGRGWDYATFGSLHPLWNVRLILPSVVGDLSRGTDWIAGGTVYGFTGVLIVLLILLYRREKTAGFWLFAGLGAWLASMGNYSPVYAVLYYLLPGVSLFRVPLHFLVIYCFAVAVLGGLVVNQIRKTGLVRKVRTVYLALVLGAIGLLIGLTGSQLLRLFTSSGLSGIPKIAAKLSYLGEIGLTEIAWSVSVNLLYLSLAVFLIFRVLPRFSRQLQMAGVIILIYMELFLYSRQNLLTITSQRAEVMLVHVAELRREICPDLRCQARIAIAPAAYSHRIVKKFGDSDYQWHESEWQFEALRPDLGIVYGIKYADGYAAMIYRPYADYWLTTATDPTQIFISESNSQLLKQAGVTHVITGRQNRVQDQISGSPIAMRIADTEPDISSENPPDMDVRVIKNFSGDVKIDVDARKAGNLFFRETNYPGWYACLDGNCHKSQTYGQVFQKIQVNSGRHTVEFRFMPDSFYRGLAVSILSGLMITTILLFRTINQQKVIKDRLNRR